MMSQYNANIYFPQCKHICVCSECIILLDKNKQSKTTCIFNDIRSEKVLIDQKYDTDKIKNALQPYPSFVIIHQGMGCVSYIRRLNKDAEIEGLFRHSDDVNKKIEDFIDGYCFIDFTMVHNWTGVV